MTCTVVNCDRPASGTATTAVGPPADVCESCGPHFYGNFTPYPADDPIDFDDPIDEYRQAQR